MSDSRTVSLFRNGRNQAVRIPVEFEMPGDEAIIRKEGERLVLEPKVRQPRRSLAELRAQMEPLSDEEFPEITDDDLLPLRDVDL